jgi:hypothetical protein
LGENPKFQKNMPSKLGGKWNCSQRTIEEGRMGLFPTPVRSTRSLLMNWD